ncbi:MAG TPA: phage tail protein [Thermoanaerobaculia bacterium]|nr:phage tail protein [Thermoanaerobaculia bacterium]
MATGDRKDPFRSFNFAVEIDGLARAGFRECSGLDASQDAIEYREGTEGLTARKLPGLNKYSNITLKWGMTDDTELWDWRKKAMTGKVERKNGSIVLLDDTGAEKMRWNFREAWPTKWTGPSFNATGNEVAIETLEIAHEGLELQE